MENNENNYELFLKAEPTPETEMSYEEAVSKPVSKQPVQQNIFQSQQDEENKYGYEMVYKAGQEEQQEQSYDQIPDSKTKGAFRYALQPAIGATNFTGYGVATNAWDMLGTGEAIAEMQKWEDGREAELRKKFPTAPWTDKPAFDKDSYMAALEEARGTLPTVDNIASFIEKHTGAPLEARNKAQRLLRLFGSGGKVTPGGFGSKTIGAIVAPTISTTAQKIGVPEPVADFIGLGVAAGVPKPGIEIVKKPSGMKAKAFENIQKETKVSPFQYKIIKKSIEKDVKKLTTDLIEKESQTARILKSDPSYPMRIEETFEEVKILAKDIPDTIPKKDIRNSYIERRNANVKKAKGISPDEFEQGYATESAKLARTISGKEKVSMSQLVEQYRKNNKSFKELYEPGQSKGKNRAKMEALLDYNKTIAEVFEKKYPNSEFNNLFKYSNKKFSELMDLNKINEFMNAVFGKEKINYKVANEFIKDSRIQKSFRNILGKDGLKDMKQIMNDFLPTERAMSLLKASNPLGFKDSMKMFGKWTVSPMWGTLAGITKGARILRNQLFTLPQFRITLKDALKDFKAGKITQAKSKFHKLNSIERQTYEKVKNYYQEVHKKNPTFKNKKILDEIYAANPEKTLSDNKLKTLEKTTKTVNVNISNIHSNIQKLQKEINETLRLKLLEDSKPYRVNKIERESQKLYRNSLDNKSEKLHRKMQKEMMKLKKNK